MERLVELIGDFGEDVVAAVAERSSPTGVPASEASWPASRWGRREQAGPTAPPRTGVCTGWPCAWRSGATLEFADDGSDPQLDVPVNAAFGVAFGHHLCGPDPDGSRTGAGTRRRARNIGFTPAPGTILNARHPAAVNRATGLGLSMAAGMKLRLLARLKSDGNRGQIGAVDGSDPHVIAGLSGVSERGRLFRRGVH